MEDSSVTESILYKVRELAAQQYDLHIGDITSDSDIIDDLGVDSLDLVEGVLLLEEEFDMDIPGEAAEQWRTIGDVAKYIEEHTN